jgi:hypothetical protein
MASENHITIDMPTRTIKLELNVPMDSIDRAFADFATTAFWQEMRDGITAAIAAQDLGIMHTQRNIRVAREEQ